MLHLRQNYTRDHFEIIGDDPVGGSSFRPEFLGGAGTSNSNSLLCHGFNVAGILNGSSIGKGSVTKRGDGSSDKWAFGGFQDVGVTEAMDSCEASEIATLFPEVGKTVEVIDLKKSDSECVCDLGVDDDVE